MYTPMLATSFQDDCLICVTPLYHGVNTNVTLIVDDPITHSIVVKKSVHLAHHICFVGNKSTILVTLSRRSQTVTDKIVLVRFHNALQLPVTGHHYRCLHRHPFAFGPFRHIFLFAICSRGIYPSSSPESPAYHVLPRCKTHCITIPLALSNRRIRSDQQNPW